MPYESALTLWWRHNILWSSFLVTQCHTKQPYTVFFDHILLLNAVIWIRHNSLMKTVECMFYDLDFMILLNGSVKICLLPLINSTIWIWHCETWTLTHSWICIFDSWTYASLCNMAPLGQPAVNGENLNAAVFLDTINVILLLTSHSWECSFLSVLTKFWWLYQISRSQWLHTVAGIWNYYICFKNIV